MTKGAKEEKSKRIAKERIEKLFFLAEKEFSKHPKRSNRYVALARKIAMKYRIKIPSNLKRRFCKNCGTYLVPGKNCMVRTKKGKAVYTCLTCQKIVRIPFLKEKKSSEPPRR